MKPVIATLRKISRAATGLLELPVPPLSLPTAENAYRIGEPILIVLNDGSRAYGTLLDFRAHRNHLLVRLDSSTVEAQEFFFKDFSFVHLLRDRRIQRLSPTLEIRGKVMMPATQQEFEVVLDSGERLTGHTFGFRLDPSGLHLYQSENSGTYTHIFIPSQAIKTQRVGPLLGEALVEEQLITYETLAAELTTQHRLRELPIGEYLVSARLVTVEELEAALERQRSIAQAKLGEILIRDGVITEAQLIEALHWQDKNRKLPLGEMLISAGLISTENLTQTLAKKLGIPFVDLREFAVDANAVKLLGRDVADKYQVMPLYVHDGRMVVAVANPLDWEALEAIRGYTKMEIEAVMATDSHIACAIEENYRDYMSKTA